VLSCADLARTVLCRIAAAQPVRAVFPGRRELGILTTAPDDRVHQRRFTGFDLRDGALDRRADLCRIFDGPFGVPADAFCNVRKVRRRAFEIHAYVRARRIGAALMRHVDLMRPIVVVGAVIVHDD